MLGTVAVQICFTLACCILSSAYEPVGAFFNNLMVLIPSIVVGLTALIMLACSENMRQQVPLNYALLAAFTWMETCSVS